jgi:hypothetical protein
LIDIGSIAGRLQSGQSGHASAAIPGWQRWRDAAEEQAALRDRSGDGGEQVDGGGRRGRRSGPSLTVVGTAGTASGAYPPAVPAPPARAWRSALLAVISGLKIVMDVLAGNSRPN